MLLLGDILVRQAQPGRNPDKVAAIFERRDGTSVSATYRGLNERANRIGNGLVQVGVAKGDRVAVLGRNSLDYVAIYFALAKIGAIMVPVNFWYRSGEIAYTLEQSGSETLIVSAAFLATLAPLVEERSLPARVFVYEGEDDRFASLAHLESTASAAEPGVPLDERDPHIILYTSGTTGFLKGAVLSHRAHYLHAIAWALQTGQHAADRGIVVYPLFHTGGPDCVVLPHFLVGATIVIHDGADAESILDAVERHRLTNVFCVPTVWRRILASPTLASRHLASVKRCLGSSDTLPVDLLDALLTAFAADAYVTYGLTEAGCILTFSRLTRESREKIASVGVPHPLVDVRIVDESGAALPTGAVGEIVARGDTLMDRYWGMPEQTATALAGGWLHTGDLGRIDEDGYVYVVGRSKDVIISGGEKIYPLEVERLLREHAAVQDCALVGVPDRTWGESVLAVVVPRPGQAPEADDLRAYVRARLAGYKAPRYVELVDALPVTTATGKVQKAVLRQRFGPKYT